MCKHEFTTALISFEFTLFVFFPQLKSIKASKYGNNTGLISVFEKLSVESQLCGGGEDGKVKYLYHN